MKIDIATKFKPFSHRAGTQVLIPGGLFVAKIYPSCLKILENNEEIYVLNFLVNDADKDFVIIQDLEKKCLNISCRSIEGYFRYCLKHRDDKIVFFLQKAPDQLIVDLTEKNSCVRVNLKPKETLDFKVRDKALVQKNIEKLSFGCHKKQDWQLVQRRNNPEEFIPFWFYLGQMTPQVEDMNCREGSLKYLSDIEILLKNKEKEIALNRLSNIFKAGFKELLIPVLYDDKFYGIFESSHDSNPIAINLLQDGYRFIRRFFIQKVKNVLWVLPNLPKDFHCGRLINVIEDDLMIDMEWSKKLLKKMKITALKDMELSFSFQNSLRFFNLKSSKRDKGIKFDVTTLLKLKQDQTYYFDNFKK